MKILAVDDEKYGLKALTKAIQAAEPSAEIFAFEEPDQALEFVKENKINVAFIDIFMSGGDYGKNGIDLAKSIKLASPATYIVFATGHDEYMKDAYQMHANGYILKPITEVKVRAELENIKSIRNNVEQEIGEKPKKRLVFQCFGDFEVFCDGIPLKFKYVKTKEMLAYLVSRRGALCTNGQIVVNLWEDDQDHDSYLRGMRKDLVDVLKEKKLENILNQQRGKLGVNVSEVECDYYDFLNGDVAAINKYCGEFMYQYNWGEFINAELMDN